MFENVGRNVALLGGAAGLTLCLASGVAVGVVPQVSGTSDVTGRPAAAVAGQDVTATTTTAPGTVAPTTVAPAAPNTVAPSTIAPVTRARSQPATTTAVSSEQASAAGPSAAPSVAPAGPTKAARLSPTSTQVQAAIAQIHQRIPLYSPTEAQARQFGDQVCSAFDQGQSSAQVQATALQAASKVPFVTVSAGDVAFAVRSAVSLFCPGYSSKV